MTRRQAALCTIGVLAVMACLARFVHLNADPSFPTWIGYVADEGRWSETARNVALFHTLDVRPAAQLHLFLGPGYQAVNFLAFLLFGVDFWSARAFTALCGAIVILTAFIALRRHVSTFALALGVAILGFEGSMLAESRMALPEMPSVLGMLLAFLVLVLGRPTHRNALLAGLLAFGALMMKGTTALVVASFPLIIMLSPMDGASAARIRRALVFVAGAVVPAIVGVTVAVAFGPLRLNQLTEFVYMFRSFLSLTTGYSILARFLDSSEFEACNLMLLGAWFCSWIWLCRDPKAPAATTKLYLASGIWAGWWLVMWAGNGYLPGRYLVNFMVPATIHLMAGLSLAGNDTISRVAAAIRQRHGLANAALLGWLVLPCAIVAATAFAGLLDLAGWESPHLSFRIGLIVLLTVVLAIAVRGGGAGTTSIAGFLVSPILITLIWLVGRELGAFHYFWQFDSKPALVAWIALIASTFTACIVFVRLWPDPQWRTCMQGALVATVTAVLLAQSVPAILLPTYSIREASLDLGRQYSATADLRTFSAESLFLANRLKFGRIPQLGERYGAIVIFEHGLPSRRFLASPRAANLSLVQTYPIVVNPRYDMSGGQFGPASIGVYRQESTGSP